MPRWSYESSDEEWDLEEEDLAIKNQETKAWWFRDGPSKVVEGEGRGAQEAHEELLCGESHIP
jgi:hypothetical protein